MPTLHGIREQRRMDAMIRVITRDSMRPFAKPPDGKAPGGETLLCERADYQPVEAPPSKPITGIAALRLKGEIRRMKAAGLVAPVVETVAQSALKPHPRVVVDPGDGYRPTVEGPMPRFCLWPSRTPVF